MTFCRNCGARLEDGAKFCTNCGSPAGQNKTDSQGAQGNHAAPGSQSTQGSCEAPGGQSTQGRYEVPDSPGSSDYKYGRQHLKDDRSLVVSILLTIITVGIYYFYFIYRLAKDTNIACADDGMNTRGLALYLVLSIITCGIYSLYWEYTLMERIAGNAPAYGIEITEKGSTVLLWDVLGYITCSIGRFIALHIIIKNSNKLFHAYNEKYGL